MKFFLSLFVALALPSMAIAQVPTDTVTVFMIGDSTMADKPLDKENQERGWGQMLPIYLEGAVRVDNHAVNGRSSKSFIDEGRWEKVREKIRPGDYVIIQFGHNDEKAKSLDRYTVPGGTFDDNLKKFVNETREKGGTPVLMNSIVRRNFPAKALQPLRLTIVRRHGRKVLKIIRQKAIRLWIPMGLILTLHVMSLKSWEWRLSILTR